MKCNISGKKGVDIQKDLVGIFFEDINYGADGGIYAEMIENRSFEFVDARGDKDAYYQLFDGLYGWKDYPKHQGAKLEIRDTDSASKVNPHYLHASLKAGTGFQNKAYDGLCIKKGAGYKVSFYVKASNECTLSIGSANEKEFHLLGEIAVSQNDSWVKVEKEFTASYDARKEVFVLMSKEDVQIDFDCISMFPADAVCGLFRRDLVEKLEELAPKFIRFPGGCIVEGNDLANRYEWKNTVGDIKDRKANWNRWAVHENNKENAYCSKYNHYNQTLGLGYFEYFMLCEHLGAKALPVANVGLACQYQSSQLVLRTNPQYQEFIQDVLDLIEFANGDVTTTWGALRAEMGHPAPFGLEYIGIGNEQWQTQRVDFFERYDDFEEAIHKVYPEIKLIGSAGPTVFTETYDAAWKNYHEKMEKGSDYTYAVDEHYYMEPAWFLKNTHFYDNYDRRIKVFSGEYAAHDPEVKESTKRNNFRCAIAEATFLTGVERNADVVYLSSYAPLFARIGYVQWAPDLIWFDDEKCYGTPSFYVQTLFSNYMGSETMESKIEQGEENGVFHVVSKSEDKVFVKLINTSDCDHDVDVIFEDGRKLKDTMKVITMHGEALDVNSIEEPTRICPVVKECETMTSVSLPAQTIMILEYHRM